METEREERPGNKRKAQGENGMSDEHEEIRKYVRDNDERIEESIKRISELEKKLELERKVKVWDANIINRTNEQLTELERDVRRLQTEYPYTTAKENSRQLDELRDDIKNIKAGIFNNAKCYNELKEEDEHIKHIVDVNRSGVSNLFTNYGELKERLDIRDEGEKNLLKNYRGVVKQVWKKEDIIEEVLRELIETVAYPFLTELEAKELLKKLDGKKEVHINGGGIDYTTDDPEKTEKKEFSEYDKKIMIAMTQKVPEYKECTTCEDEKVYTKDCEVCDDFDKWKSIKASGGEKPPEPHQCAECWGYRMGKHIMHKDGCSKSPIATNTETREDDKIE